MTNKMKHFSHKTGHAIRVANSLVWGGIKGSGNTPLDNLFCKSEDFVE